MPATCVVNKSNCSHPTVKKKIAVDLIKRDFSSAPSILIENDEGVTRHSLGKTNESKKMTNYTGHFC